MLKLKTEAKIGIIVLVTILFVIWGINFLKGRNILKRTDVYHAVYTNIQGIDVSAPVIINGYQVGLINNIQFASGSLEKIIISFTVDEEFQIPKNSTVELFSADLLGSKALRILPSSESGFHKHGDTLISSVEVDMITSIGDEVSPLAARVESAIIEIDSLLGAINYVLDEETKASIQRSISNIDRLSNNLAMQSSPGGDLYQTIESLNQFSQTLSENSSELDTIFTNLKIISDSVAKSNIQSLVNSTHKTFEETSLLLEKINKGEGSLGLLATNDSLYTNLTRSIESLDILLNDLRENPGRYVQFSVFGRKSKNE